MSKQCHALMGNVLVRIRLILEQLKIQNNFGPTSQEIISPSHKRDLDTICLALVLCCRDRNPGCSLHAVFPPIFCMSLPTQALRWLLDFQSSYLHPSQQEGRRWQGRRAYPLYFRTLNKSCIHRFYLLPESTTREVERQKNDVSC